MGELLGQSVIVENVTGAGGIIGVQRVINAKPDGYTVLLGTVGTHAYAQSIYRKRRYDAVSDFTPVTLFSDQRWCSKAARIYPPTTLRNSSRCLNRTAGRCNTARQALDRLRILLARCSTRGSAST